MSDTHWSVADQLDCSMALSHAVGVRSTGRGDLEPHGRRRRRHALVVGDDLAEINPEPPSGGQVNGIQGSKLHGLERSRTVEDAIIAADQVNAGQHASTGSQRGGPSTEEGPKDLGPCEGTRHQGSPPSKVAAQCVRLRLAHCQLHDGRGVQVRGRHGQRSFLRSRRSAALGVSTPGGNSSKAGSSSRSPDPGSTSPAARICSSGVPAGIGVSRATGRPRSVISTVSPCSTNRSSSLARWRSSRTPTDVMCYL